MLVLTDAEWDALMRAVIHYRALAAEFDNDVDYANLVALEEKLLALKIEHNQNS